MTKEDAMKLTLGTNVRIDGVTFQLKKGQRHGKVEQIMMRGEGNPLISVRIPDGRLEPFDCVWVELPQTPLYLSTGFQTISKGINDLQSKRNAALVEFENEVEQLNKNNVSYEEALEAEEQRLRDKDMYEDAHGFGKSRANEGLQQIEAEGYYCKDEEDVLDRVTQYSDTLLKWQDMFMEA